MRIAALKKIYSLGLLTSYFEKIVPSSKPFERFYHMDIDIDAQLAAKDSGNNFALEIHLNSIGKGCT